MSKCTGASTCRWMMLHDTEDTITDVTQGDDDEGAGDVAAELATFTSGPA